MDIMMPVMDGYETIARHPADRAVRDLPIIAVTGKVVPASANAASTPAPTTTSPSRSTPPSSWPQSGRGCRPTALPTA